MVASVAELVDDDKLAKMLGQEHNEERDTDAIASATRTPTGVSRGDAKRGISKAVLRCKALDGRGDILASLTA